MSLADFTWYNMTLRFSVICLQHAMQIGFPLQTHSFSFRNSITLWLGITDLGSAAPLPLAFSFSQGGSLWLILYFHEAKTDTCLHLYHVERETHSATSLHVAIAGLQCAHKLFYIYAIIPEMITNYLEIMLDARQALLFQKLCEHNVRKPT